MGSAFSNGTEHERWAANWCDRCLVDAPFRNNMKGATGCPIIAKAMFEDVIPVEWIEQPPKSYPDDAYHCINFKPRGWRNPEPQPQPDPQPDALFDAPVRAARMLVQPAEPSVLAALGLIGDTK